MTSAEWDGLRRAGVNLHNGDAIAAFLNEGKPAEQHRAVEVLGGHILEFTGQQWRALKKARTAGFELNTPEQISAFFNKEPRRQTLLDLERRSVPARDARGDDARRLATEECSINVMLDPTEIVSVAAEQLPPYVRTSNAQDVKRMVEALPTEQRLMLTCAGCKAKITTLEYAAAGNCCPHCGVIARNPSGVLEVGA